MTCPRRVGMLRIHVAVCQWTICSNINCTLFDTLFLMASNNLNTNTSQPCCPYHASARLECSGAAGNIHTHTHTPSQGYSWASHFIGIVGSPGNDVSPFPTQAIASPPWPIMSTISSCNLMMMMVEDDAYVRLAQCSSLYALVSSSALPNGPYYFVVVLF